MRADDDASILCVCVPVCVYVGVDELFVCLCIDDNVSWESSLRAHR